MRRRSAKKYTDVSISIFGRQKRFRAFCDSGNLLRDPISGKLCVIARRDAIRDMLPQDISSVVVSKDMSALSKMDAEQARRIRLIPAATAVGDGMLVALRADGIWIGEKMGEEVDALVAVVESERFDGECDVLLPSELLI